MQKTPCTSSSSSFHRGKSATMMVLVCQRSDPIALTPRMPKPGLPPPQIAQQRRNLGAPVVGTPVPRWAVRQSIFQKPAVLPLLPHIEVPSQYGKQEYFLDQGLN